MTRAATHKFIFIRSACQPGIVKKKSAQFNAFTGHWIIFRNVNLGWETWRDFEVKIGRPEGINGMFVFVFIAMGKNQK
jgi:hypothetical protein